MAGKDVLYDAKHLDTFTGLPLFTQNLRSALNENFQQVSYSKEQKRRQFFGTDTRSSLISERKSPSRSFVNDKSKSDHIKTLLPKLINEL